MGVSGFGWGRESGQVAGQLLVPDVLELHTPGEVVDAADQNRSEALARHSELEYHLSLTDYGHGAGTEDIGEFRQANDDFVNQTPQPSVGYERDQFLEAHEHGHVTSTIAGQMPEVPNPTGDPPQFTDDGIMFDPRLPALPPTSPPTEPKHPDQPLPERDGVSRAPDGGIVSKPLTTPGNSIGDLRGWRVTGNG